MENEVQAQELLKQLAPEVEVATKNEVATLNESEPLQMPEIKVEPVEKKALKACDEAKMLLPEKPFGGKYYDNDKKEYVENPAAIKADNARYWAKENCKFCYGRGIEGKITIPVDKGRNSFVMDAMCVCARRRYGRWRDNFVENWLKEYNNAEK